MTGGLEEKGKSSIRENTGKSRKRDCKAYLISQMTEGLLCRAKKFRLGPRAAKI